MSPDLSWTPALGSVLALVAYLGLYAWRWTAARRSHGPEAASAARAATFAAGLLVLAIALVSPLDRLGEQLFVMHMVQHVLLIDLAAILLLLGLTPALLEPLARAMDRAPRPKALLARPTFAVAFYAITLWAWHAPPLYGSALQSPAVHALQHLSFAAAGLLFWWHVVSPLRSKERLGGPAVALYFAGAKLLNGALATAIVFWPTVLYPFYANRGPFWGLDVLEDQELGGAVLIIEESALLFVAFIGTFFRMLGESEAAEREREELEDLHLDPDDQRTPA